MFPSHQKRLLALDGGGIKGVITLQMLKRIEDQLRPFSDKGEAFVLSDFFDYFGGTSTGAILASGLAMGMKVDDLIRFYDDSGAAMFAKSGLFWRLFYRFTDQPLAERLRKIIGTGTVLEMLDTGALKSHLLIVTRNATTDSSWMLTTNRDAVYNDVAHEQCNLKIPLWQLVRASTAAPTYFRPEIITLGNTRLQFVDGGVTPYNCPAFLLFKKATMPEYRLRWPRGEDRLMLVSVGTGYTRKPQPRLRRRGRWVGGNAAAIPGELMNAIRRENDMNCRLVGRCVYAPHVVDSEIGDMIRPLAAYDNLGKSFLYARYDVEISQDGLDAAGFGGINARSLTMENVAMIPQMKMIGAKAAEQINMPTHFGTFIPSRPPVSLAAAR